MEEANIKQTNDNLPQKEATEMVWLSLKGGYNQEDDQHASAGKEKKGRIPPRQDG